ncbi:threonylcarbamoyl-AMP synthase [Synechococcales cyanobacterium C]|uniref:Threonylcarbamoyl-AMP synthase n=1 Tax=Petrachloros mirabilis ULC683 TaxID=2781853 RepID=A0A8K2A934_9CYAN|nr:L-threonylcarbamoyladenylate synthase [Petrachloros mirabilis]NCJ07720.1 threonylcarbamoyl-AMP synthase [Petrachloros mirabilis ULC683]
MAHIFTVHPDNPQTRTIEQICTELLAGAIMLYPTDTVYAIGCDLNSKAAVQRVRQLKQLSNDKPLTFLCPSLSDIARYAQVTDAAYRTMKRLVPGPFTFLLPATKLVPRLVQNPKRKSTGIRVPSHTVCQALLQVLGNPVISTSAPLAHSDSELDPLDSEPLDGNLSQAELFDRFQKSVDIIVDNGQPPTVKVSTILDLCQSEPRVLRKGLGWDTVQAVADVLEPDAMALQERMG